MRALCTAAICAGYLAGLLAAQENTASLAGKVVDITGAGLRGTIAELQSEEAPVRKYRSVADDSGDYRFPALPGGTYTIVLQQAGFRNLVVQHIQLSWGEQKSLPTLRMDVGMGCGGAAIVEHLRLQEGPGSFGATIRVDRGPLHPDGSRLSRASVNLVCNKGRNCGSTTTNSQGEFAFHNLPSGSYAIRATHAGFHSIQESGYEVRAGLESIYDPIYMEQCPAGNCDPRLRPRKTPSRCE